jgi:hypothetical protein
VKQRFSAALKTLAFCTRFSAWQPTLELFPRPRIYRESVAGVKMGDQMRREIKKLTTLLAAVALFVAAQLLAADAPPKPTPILVELFTSEGCSTCPPADALLEKLDSSQPVPGAQLIVLSEHVDYWDRLGWKDPFSSSVVTDRQAVYAAKFKLESSYTPQMIVDGSTEFVGNNSHLAEQALQKAVSAQKGSIRISSVSSDAPGKLSASLEADGLPAGTNADVYFVVALNHAESQVERGENKGHHLVYVAVVESITKVGTTDKSRNFAKQIEVKIHPHTDLSNVRVIAFLQQHGSGPVIGAAMSTVPPQSASQ